MKTNNHNNNNVREYNTVADDMLPKVKPVLERKNAIFVTNDISNRHREQFSSQIIKHQKVKKQTKN